MSRNSHFDSSQTGDGMDVQGGTVTIINSYFNNNGTAGGFSPGGSGFSIEGNSQVTIMNSQFIGNLNANLVAAGAAQVTAQGSTFNQSQQGDGALFANSGAVNLTGNTFAMNSTVRGFAPGVGFDGVEFPRLHRACRHLAQYVQPEHGARDLHRRLLADRPGPEQHVRQ